MCDLALTHYQRILDTFSVGKIAWVDHFSTVQAKTKSGMVELCRSVIETSHGLYLLVYASNDEIHPLWWASKHENFLSFLQRASGLKFGQAVSTQTASLCVVHKYDYRFVLFKL